MKKIRLPLLSLLLLCFAAPSQAFELTVLHTNDVHSMYGGTTEKRDGLLRGPVRWRVRGQRAPETGRGYGARCGTECGAP